MLDRYELDEEIGRGGLSVVYRARHITLNRTVALKVPILDDPTAVERFRRSAEFTARMSHPNVGTIFDCFEHDGRPHLVMEYLEGGSLRGHIGKLTLAQLAGVMEDVLAGLEHIASHGVVHRDLKPENLLIDADGRVKVVDLSIAQVPVDPRLTPPGLVLGTPWYMSPEQAMGRVLDVRSDLYALGCVTFELVTGKLPHDDGEPDPMRMLSRRVTEPAPAMVGADPGLGQWVLRLLAREPEHRPPSAREAWVELEQLLGAGRARLDETTVAERPEERYVTGAAPVVGRTCSSCGRTNPWDRDFCECGEYLRWDDVPDIVAKHEAPVEVVASARPAPTTQPSETDRLTEAWGQAHVSPVATSSGELVDCTVFAPPQLRAGDRVMLQVFAHTIEQAQQAEQMARMFDEASRPRGVHSLAERIERETRLTFELVLPGFGIDEPVQSLVWRGQPRAVQFDAMAPTKPCTAIGTVIVRADLLPIGHIKFKLDVTASAADDRPIAVGESAKRYRRAFLSYASEDRAQVLDRVQVLRLLQIEYFHDLLSLDPGQRWERELYRQIEASDLFLLFWSEHARDSDWVRREARHALALCGDDQLAPPQICPVILAGPPVAKPWEELAHLHFNDELVYVRAAETAYRPTA